jgi:ABC-type glycerol-3-phosphate transport system substrate-binding protein
MAKGTAIGKKEIFQFGLLIGFFFLGYYMWTSRDVLAVKRALNKMPDNLQAIFKTLKDKGYNPETSPVSFSGFFIKFVSGNVQVVINASESISFFYDKTKPPYIAQYTNGILSGKHGIIADNDIVSAILQIIENKDYE